MRFAEKVLVFFYVIGMCMLLAHLQDYMVFILASITGIALLYFFGGFALYNGIRLRAVFKRASYAGSTTNNIIMAAITGIVHAITLVGFLFSLQHWPGGTKIFGCGLFLTVLLSIVVYFGFRKKSPVLYKNVVARLQVFCFIAVAQSVPRACPGIGFFKIVRNMLTVTKKSRTICTGHKTIKFSTSSLRIAL